MKKFIIFVLMLGLCGVVAAQDLDSPTSGATLDQQDATPNTVSGVFDALVARIQEGKETILNGRVFNWRGRYWEIWAWERSTTNESNFRQWGNWSGTDLSTEWDVYQEQREQLTAAEQAQVAELARDAHQQIMAEGLN